MDTASSEMISNDNMETMLTIADLKAAATAKLPKTIAGMLVKAFAH